MAGIIRDIFTWDAYGVASALPSFADWNVLYPAAWSTVAVSGAPWHPIGGNSVALQFTGASAPSAGTNPGPGVYSLPRWAGMQGVILGVWVKFTAWPSSGIACIRLNNSRTIVGAQVPPQGVDQSYLSISSSGVITALNASNVSAGTYSSLSLNTWYWMEYFLFVGDASGGSNKQGSTQLSINGTAQITNTNCATRFGSNSYDCDIFTLDGEFDQTANVLYGPGYWMDANGGGAANMLGKQYFHSFFASAISGSTVFTDAGSSHIGDISTAPPGGGSAYIYDISQGAQELYTAGTFDVSGINGVAVQLAAAQNARGGRMVSPLVKSGGTLSVMGGMGTKGGANTAGGSYADSTGFILRRALALVDPHTSAAWTQASVNSATFGVEVFQ